MFSLLARVSLRLIFRTGFNMAIPEIGLRPDTSNYFADDFEEEEIILTCEHCKKEFNADDENQFEICPDCEK